MKSSRRILIATVWLLSHALAGFAHSNELSFDSESACLVNESHTMTIDIEIARSSEQRQQGLMSRQTLNETAGMLFVYSDTRPPSHAFWMRNTLIPLDIAFIDSSGRIGAINTMEPCPSEALRCPSYPSGASFNLALEMNKGFFSQNGFAVGDRFSRGKDCD